MFESLGTSKDVVVAYKVTFARDETGKYTVALFRETVGKFNHDRSNREELDCRRMDTKPTLSSVIYLLREHLSGDRLTYDHVVKNVKAMLWEHQTEDESVTWVEYGDHRISVTTPSNDDSRHEFWLYERSDIVVRQMFGPLMTETKPTRSLFVTGIANRWAQVDHETLKGLTDALEAAGCFAAAKTDPAPEEQES